LIDGANDDKEHQTPDRRGAAGEDRAGGSGRLFTAPLDLQQIKNKKTDFFKAALEDAAR
jgi:hypothetical protein